MYLRLIIIPVPHPACIKKHRRNKGGIPYTGKDRPPMLYEEMLSAIHERLEHSRSMPDEEVYRKIDELLSEISRKNHLLLSQRAALRTRLFNALRRLDVLQELLDDDEITEIMVNGTDGIFIEKNGRISRWHGSFRTQEALEDIALRIAAGVNRTANELNAIVDARLPGGERVSIVMQPIAIAGPVLTIRRFPVHPITMEQLIRWESLTDKAGRFLNLLIKSRYNIFISGGTGSGKTTFLNALSSGIPKDERIITIEDNAELQIRGIPNLVRLEARRPNDEGAGEVTIRDLIRASLRMRPDRIIVGEVRGSETVDMLQAMNTGHDGSLTTGHGNSPQDMLSRLETMLMMTPGMELPLAAIRRQIASGLDIMIHLARLRDKSRRVLSITEIDGYDPSTGEILLHPLFEFTESGERPDGFIIGKLSRCGVLRHRGKMRRAGLEKELLALEAQAEN